MGSSTVAAIGWGGLLVVAVVIVTFFGVAYGLKTRQGSGINEHPGPDSVDPKIPAEPDGAETGARTTPGPESGTAPPKPDDDLGSEEDKDSILEQRGTK